MGIQIYPTVPVAQAAAEPWPVDDHTIRVDEMFARRLDTEFSAGVRTLLHDPETGLSSLKGEAALEAIAGALPALEELKQRTLAQAMGPRQKALLAPSIDTRLDWATGTIGRLAERATVEVDDRSVAERIAGLQQDAATAWHDPAYLQKLGRAAVSELRWQGERRGWDSTETESRTRAGLSDLYAGAVEAAIGQNLDGAASLLAHADDVIDPARQEAIDHRLSRARDDGFLREVDAALANLPLDPAAPPALDAFIACTEELTPEGADDDPNDLFPAWRLPDHDTPEDLFHRVQDVRDNQRQGHAKEDSVVEGIKRTDPEAKIVRQAQVHVEGGPKYMVADIIFSGNGTSAIQILEVKSGEGRLTPNQSQALAEAAKTGNIYLVNPEHAKTLRIEAGKTFGAQGILPQVTVVGGDQEAIRRQMIRAGLEVVPEGTGRGGRPHRFRMRPN